MTHSEQVLDSIEGQLAELYAEQSALVAARAHLVPTRGRYPRPISVAEARRRMPPRDRLIPAAGD